MIITPEVGQLTMTAAEFDQQPAAVRAILVGCAIADQSVAGLITFRMAYEVYQTVQPLLVTEQHANQIITH